MSKKFICNFKDPKGHLPVAHYEKNLAYTICISIIVINNT